MDNTKLLLLLGAAGAGYYFFVYKKKAAGYAPAPAAGKPTYGGLKLPGFTLSTSGRLSQAPPDPPPATVNLNAGGFSIPRLT